MGTRGTGAFGDYKSKGNENLCLNPLKNINLDDVARSEYYDSNRNVPEVMHPVRIRPRLYNSRLAIESLITSEIIGLLPSKYSYILGCIKKGHTYEGNVDFSTVNPFPKVMVSLDAK